MDLKRFYLGIVMTLALATPAAAALKVGSQAPDFTAPATLGGNEFSFHLSEALTKGPVVIYFYPAAFTQGCTIEAHEFAEAMPSFRALGASVIGVSHDDIATLNKFSVSECQSKFPVAADRDRSVMKKYDASLGFLTPYAARISYVIAPNGKVVMSYSDLDPDQHVSKTLNAVRSLSQH